MSEQLFRISYIANYHADNNEDHHDIPALANMGALEDIIADVMDDPLISSAVFTIVKA